MILIMILSRFDHENLFWHPRMGLENVRDWLQKLMVYWIFEEGEYKCEFGLTLNLTNTTGR